LKENKESYYFHTHTKNENNFVLIRAITNPTSSANRYVWKHHQIIPSP